MFVGEQKMFVHAQGMYAACKTGGASGDQRTIKVSDVGGLVQASVDGRWRESSARSLKLVSARDRELPRWRVNHQGSGEYWEGDLIGHRKHREQPCLALSLIHI